MSSTENIIDLLSRLGVATLSKYVSKERIKRLNDAGYEVGSKVLADVLFHEFGSNVFSIKDVRLELLASLGREGLKDKLGLSDPTVEDLMEINAFRWGDNSSTKGFLKLFGLSGLIIRESTRNTVSVEEVCVIKPLFSYQNWIRKRIIDFIWGEKSNRVLVHMPTGSGKTRTMLESVCDYFRNSNKGKVVVWLAHSEELCDQAVSSFISLWEKLGSENAGVMKLWGGRSPETTEIDRPYFVVASFQTATNIVSTQDDERFKLFSSIRRNCGLLIVDEAHQSIAPTYKDAVDLLSSSGTKIVGLTATPGRHHVNQDPQQTIKLSEFYDNNKINIVSDDGDELNDPINYLTNKGILAKVNRFRVDSGASIRLTEKELVSLQKRLDIPDDVLIKLGRDINRTGVIVKHAMKLSKEYGFPTIIFAPSVENAVDISIMLSLNKVESKAITSETPRDERRETIRDFKSGALKVIVNFGVLTTGFDAPNIKAVIIARPTTSVVLYSQMIGRGLRGPSMGGESECYLIDIEDNILNMPVASNAFTYFNQYYT